MMKLAHVAVQFEIHVKEPPHSDKRAKRIYPNKKTRESFGVVEVVDDDT